MSAQSLSEAQTAYRTFLRLDSEGGDKASAYSALYRCYKGYSAVLAGNASATVTEEAKSVLRTIRPHLQNGAIYSSKRGLQSNAILFARAFVDIPLMPAFKGERFVHDSYYPTMVYFAASGTYNSGDFSGAVPYFREYLSTGATERRKDVYVFMLKSLVDSKDYSQAKDALKDAMLYYPGDADFQHIQNRLYAEIGTSPHSGIPKYSDYAKAYVEERIHSWQAKDPYETIAEYKERVSDRTRDAKVKELLREAESTYIDTYSKNAVFSNMVLNPYDAENEVFLAESDYGEIIIPVPKANNEARVFENSWNGMQFRNPKFFIDNDRLALSSLTFTTPSGRSYSFSNRLALNYTETVVDMKFGAIDYSQLAQNDDSPRRSAEIRKNRVSVGTSDVDSDIPKSKTVNDKTFAVIIANEDYEMVAGVPMALNDGRVFGAYCRNTLGLPESNVRLYENATYGTMLRAMRDIKSISDAYSGDIKVIFYYAGHGIPDESTKDAFLLPVDSDGLQTEVCYPLNKLYRELGNLNATSVLVFLDACFSGANREGTMLASARGVALKAKKEVPQGNMVIFSAASGDETAFPYKEKGHGLFTYFLLKKLQETEGNVSLAELSDYVTGKVRQQSVVINRKPQTPVIMPAASMAEQWKNIKMK